MQQGSIVWAQVRDDHGGNPKERPLVIVTPTDQIGHATPIVAVAVTTSFREPIEPSMVALPWQVDGKVRTRLRRPCVAVCDWMVEIRESDVLRVGGVCPDGVLRKILLRIPEDDTDDDGC